MGPGGETSTGVCRVRPDGGPAVAIANYRSSNVVLILIGTASCALPQGPIQHSSPDPPLLGKLRIELGSVDISSHPDESTDEMEESEVPVGQLVEPGEEATEMLDLADEAFNEVAFPVQMRVV